MMKKQPHIVLPHVHALIHTSDNAKDNTSTTTSSNRNSSSKSKKKKTSSVQSVLPMADQKKSIAASKVLDEYRKMSNVTENFCQGYDLMSILYIKLAMYKHRDDQAKHVKMSDITNWSNITRDLKDTSKNSCAILTAHIDQLLCSAGDDYNNNNTNAMDVEKEDDDDFVIVDEAPGETKENEMDLHSTVPFFKSFHSHFEQIFSGLSRPKLVTVIQYI